jgi:hypothetical protein
MLSYSGIGIYKNGEWKRQGVFFIAFCFLFLNPVKAGGVDVVVDFDL